MGKLLVILGIIIALGSGSGVVATLAILLFAWVSDKNMAIALSALSFCGAGLAAGITAVHGGKWQAKHGRTGRMFVWTFFGLIFLMLILGRIFSFVKSWGETRCLFFKET